MDDPASKIRLLMTLRRAGIGDLAVLGAIETIPRDRFVPHALRAHAWEDAALPIGAGQTISRPSVVASMTQALRLNERHKVLEIGTGSGYQTAVLARLCLRVYTIERHAELQAPALALLEDLRIRNVTARVGDGARGWKEQAPFARIIVTAAALGAAPPPALLAQLAPDGVMVVPLTGADGQTRIERIERSASGALQCQTLELAPFVPLVTAELAPLEAGALP